MPDFFPNESQTAREVLMNQIKAMSDQSVGNWVNVSGDTMTGNLEVPTFVSTGAASITGPINVTNTLNGSTMVLTGAASIAGNVRFGGQMNGLGLALTSLASISSTLNVGNTLTATSGVTLNPVIIAQQSVIGGATIAPLRIIASAASQAFFDFRGAIISTASLNLAANQVAGAIQVWVNGEGGPAIGYLPIFKGVV